MIEDIDLPDVPVYVEVDGQSILNIALASVVVVVLSMIAYRFIFS